MHFTREPVIVVGHQYYNFRCETCATVPKKTCQTATGTKMLRNLGRSLCQNARSRILASSAQQARNSSSASVKSKKIGLVGVGNVGESVNFEISQEVITLKFK